MHLLLATGHLIMNSLELLGTPGLLNDGRDLSTFLISLLKFSASWGGMTAVGWERVGDVAVAPSLLRISKEISTETSSPKQTHSHNRITKQPYFFLYFESQTNKPSCDGMHKSFPPSLPVLNYPKAVQNKLLV